MSVDSSRAWENEFQARFGVAPGTPELQERERLVQMCKELLQERDRLRADLGRLQQEHDAYYHAFNALMKKEHAQYLVDKETLLADIDKETTIEQLVAELESGEEV